MKALLALVMVTGLAIGLRAEPLLTDIVTYEAIVIDEAYGNTLATGGPWIWQDQTYQVMAGPVSGAGRTVVVKCRNADGVTIFGGTILGADLTVPSSPFFPPDPSGRATLTFFCDNYSVIVFLNGQYDVGTMAMLPAQDDPVEPLVKAVVVDIKPGSATNPFNTRSQGVLPVALLGSSEVDISQIDPSSVKLAGLTPVRRTVADVQNDGLADLVLHFRDRDVAALLAGVKDGEVVGLELTGVMLDGTAIKGTDSITIIAKQEKSR